MNDMIMDDDIGGSNESIRDVGMDVVVTEGDQTSPEESNPAKKSKRKYAKLYASYAFREQRIFMQYAYAFWRPCVCVCKYAYAFKIEYLANCICGIRK